MLQPIVANGIDAAVLRVPTQIYNVDFGAIAANEGLKFVLVEHGEPRRGYDFAEALHESVCLLPGLDLQAVTGEIRDVDEAVCVCDGELGAVGAEVMRDGFGWVGGREGVGDGEIKGEVFDVARVVFELEL